MRFELPPGAGGPEISAATIARPGDARSGSLLLKSEAGYAEAARLGIDIDLTVTGPTVRTRVTQIFHNPTKDWVEASMSSRCRKTPRSIR